MKALLLAVLPLAAWAQLTVSTVSSSGVETRVDSLIDVGVAEAGDFLDTRVRLWNRGQTVIPLKYISIAGAGFSLLGTPWFPYDMAPSTNVDFRIRFVPGGSGSYTATLLINDTPLLVRATSPPAATIYWENPPGKFQLVTNQYPLDFGRVDLGSNVARRFQLVNESTVKVTVAALTVSGQAFAAESPPTLPADLAPGASVTFQIRFTAVRPGVPQGTLQVGNRVVSLTGFVPEPPLPDALITFDSESVSSAQQGRVTVKLAGPAKAAVSGTLTLEFRPSISGVSDDSAVQFLPSGTRSAPIAIAAGAAAVAAAQVFQTGTTAGVLTFRLSFAVSSQTRTASLTVTPQAIHLDTAQLTRTATTIEISAAGFDNARSTTQAVFSFLDRAGRPLVNSPYRGNVSDLFARHFRDSPLGGMFRMTASFPVTGDPAQIGGVQLEIGNSIGSARADLGGN